MEYCVPELGEGVHEAELVEWQIQPGDTIRQGQKLAEVVTDKASMELPSPFAGTVRQLLATPGQSLRVGDPLLAYVPLAASGDSRPVTDTTDAGANRHVERSQTVADQCQPTCHDPQTQVDTKDADRDHSNDQGHTFKASPSVRRMARALGLDLGQVTGSGPAGRILIEDIAARVPTRTATTRRQTGAHAILDLGVAGTRIAVRGVRRRVAENMILSKKVVPHYSYVDECDITEILALSRALKRPLLERGVRLTNLAFFVKAVASALQDVPIVNASLEEETAEIALHDQYHVGIATTTDKGLTVPVIHDADRRDLVDIAREIDRLTRAVRDGRIQPAELRGGTFTISSVGSIGGMVTTPIINHPEAGIMGVGRVFKRPAYDDHDRIVPAHVVYLSFSFDHRIVDGSVGATFGNAVIRHLMNPAPMLLTDPNRPAPH